jgi:uncharacterized protein YbjT (DUF2867 family)
MTIRPIIFGATGMVGEGVLHEALRHPAVDSVLVIGRRPSGVRHERLQEIVHHDFFDYSGISDRLKGYSACFFCLGVSSIGMTGEEYRRLTYDLTMAAAKALVSLNPAMTFCYVSGAGTDSSERGRSMWARVKGKTENDLRALPFKAAYAFRPGFIRPTSGLKHAYTISRILGVAYPVWRAVFPKYVCTLEDLGRAMIHAAASGYERPVLENRDIARLGHSPFPPGP